MRGASTIVGLPDLVQTYESTGNRSHLVGQCEAVRLADCVTMIPSGCVCFDDGESLGLLIRPASRSLYRCRVPSCISPPYLFAGDSTATKERLGKCQLFEIT